MDDLDPRRGSASVALNSDFAGIRGLSDVLVVSAASGSGCRRDTWLSIGGSDGARG